MTTPATGLTADAVADTSGLVRVRWTGDAAGLYQLNLDGRIVRRVVGTFAEIVVSGRGSIEVLPAVSDDDYSTVPDSEVPPTRAAIEWHCPSTSDAEKYRVYWDAGAGVPPATLLEEVDYVGQWTRSIETPPLDSGTTYAFKITAVDAAGNESTGTTFPLMLRTLPAPPSNLSIALNSGTGRASLSWV